MTNWPTSKSATNGGIALLLQSAYLVAAVAEVLGRRQRILEAFLDERSQP